MYILFAVMTDEVNTTAAANKVIFDSIGIMNPDINQTDTQLLCSYSAYQFSQLQCDQGRLQSSFGYCVTYDEKIKLLSVFNCPYFQWEKFNNGIQLPRNLSQLND